MLVTTVDKKIKFYQRVILMIMLVFMPFYSVGSDFFLEGFPSSSIEVVENGVHDVLDFDCPAGTDSNPTVCCRLYSRLADYNKCA